MPKLATSASPGTVSGTPPCACIAAPTSCSSRCSSFCVRSSSLAPPRRLRLHEHDRQQPAARHRRGARPRRDRRAGALGLRDLEVGVLGQHAPLQVAQATARLEPVLLAEVAGQLAVARQRLGRAAAAVQHQQPLLLQALAQPVLGSRRLDVRGDLGVAAQRQVRLEAILQRLQPALLQARRLEPDQVRVAAARERRAAPEGQGRAQQLAGRRRRPRPPALGAPRRPAARTGSRRRRPAATPST